eukprot:evm.model.scf_119EXC.19 EVM.evm.TU.scf_119EXC.19   scf_119EXC:121012-122439(+)
MGCGLAAGGLSSLREACQDADPSLNPCGRFDLWWWFWAMEVMILSGLGLAELAGRGHVLGVSGPGLLALGVMVGQDTTNYFARESRAFGHGVAAAGFGMMTAGNAILIVAVGRRGGGAGGEGGARLARWASRCTVAVAVFGLLAWMATLGGARRLCSAPGWDCGAFGLLWWLLALEALALGWAAVVALCGASRAAFAPATTALLAAPLGHLTLYTHSLAPAYSPETRLTFSGVLLLAVINFSLILATGLQSAAPCRRASFARQPILLSIRGILVLAGCCGWVLAMVGVHRGYAARCQYADYDADGTACDLLNFFWWRFALEGLALLAVAFSLAIDFPPTWRSAWVAVLAVAASHPMFFADQFRHYGTQAGDASDDLSMAGYVAMSVSSLGLIVNMGWVGGEDGVRRYVEGNRGRSQAVAVGPRGPIWEPLLFSVSLNTADSSSVTDEYESMDMEGEESAGEAGAPESETRSDYNT